MKTLATIEVCHVFSDVSRFVAIDLGAYDLSQKLMYGEKLKLVHRMKHSMVTQNENHKKNGLFRTILG